MIRQVAKYGLVGAIGTIAHYLTLVISVEWLQVTPILATSLGFIVGAFINYVLNYKFTFYSSNGHSKALPRFMAFAAIGGGINLAVFQVLTSGLLLHYFFSQLVCTAFVMSITFLLNKKFTF